MNYREAFGVEPGSRVRLADFDPRFTDSAEKKKHAHREIASLQERMDALQVQLYAEQKRSLLICLQAPDAGGKDGVVRHVIGSMNPQGCHVVGFKQPSTVERAHDFLWRIEHETSKRLVANGTHILKFFLHISKEEQLSRFKDRLDDPARHWKISEADYSERKYWADYEKAYEAALARCSTDAAPWFVIPSDHKWFRNLAVSRIIVETMENLGIEVPKPTVSIAGIRKKYHRAVAMRKKAKGQ